ncbi:MAG: glycerophosphodiester phosphodiesterase family protein [Lachnospiraceae bacterium]
MKQNFKEVRQMMRANRKQLVLFELLYKGLFALVMLPLLELSLRFAIKFSGYSYVTPENIFYVLKKPVTIVILLILFGSLFLFSFVELISMIVFFRACEEKRTLKVTQILFPGFKRAVRMLKTQNSGGLILGTLLFSVVSNLPLWIAFYMRFSALRFLLNEAWRLPWFRIGGCLLLFLLLFFGFFGLFVLHYCCLRQTTFLQGMKRSIRAMFSNRGRAAGTMVLWNLRFFALEAFGYLAILLLLIFVGSFFVPENRLFAFLLILEDNWNLYGGMLAATIGLVAELGMLSHLFYLLPGEEENKDFLEEYDESFSRGKQDKLLRVLTVLTVVGNVINLTLLFWNGSLLEREVLQETAITAHRGASLTAPENTLSALSAAIENLADYAEIDVQETADGVVVLMHDYSLKRTTGQKKYVYYTTYEELKEYDCGSWFSAEFAGERIPTLEQALELCKGKIYLNIELKGAYNREELAEKVAQLIEEYDFENQCVVTSTSQEILLRVKELNENIKTGYIMSLAYGDFYEKEGIDFFSMKSSFIDEKVVETAHRFGKEIHAWTVNSRSELERMKLIGVDNIITDDPILAREVLESEGISGTLFELLKMILQN